MSPSPTTISDEPLTPAGRLFLNPELNTIIHCVLGTETPIHQDVDLIKETVKDSLLLKHPRFCSLMVTDSNGNQYWRKTQLDIDRHVIVVSTELTSVNDYLADLSVSCPLSLDKPLWEIHLLKDHKCIVFRIHHALGDGISLMSLLLASCRSKENPEDLPRLRNHGTGGPSSSYSKSPRVWGLGNTFLELVKWVFFSLVYIFEFIVRSLWVCDRKTVISGGDGVELWPRKLATARFSLDDMKIVKGAVDGAGRQAEYSTVNDVLFGIISSGLSRYLDHRSPKGLEDGLRLTGVAMVNLREQTGLQDLNELMKSNPKTRWGNKFGMILLPVYYHKTGDSPLEYLKRAKKMIDRKKKSLEAYMSYVIGDFVTTWLGSKYACLCNYRILCNSTFTISNVIGPQEEITIAGKPITYIWASTTSLPHALTMHMVSYAGKADMQILVAKDIIPDPEFLAKCFENSLLEMKEAALADKKT
ncbi:hypothetical protein ACFE04_024309 [Oxalis oulophora]